MADFEIRHRDGLARLGVFNTAHGPVHTPTLLPVINPNLVSITPNEMRERFGTQMVITNSYIIKKSERLREKALADGLHSLIDFDGPIMTDSGTFQSHIYGEVNLGPQEIVAFQRDIGSDVGTILDIFSEPHHDRGEAAAGLKETILRAQDSVNYSGTMELALPIQGGVFPEFRERCAREMSALPAGIHPVGGVVPLMEDYRYADVIKIVIYAKKGLRHDRPVHLFGCGHPMFFPLAALAGCDLFDSASYIKYARGNRIMFPWGTRHLEDLREISCNCPVCKDNTVKDLLGMENRERHRLLALHNLDVSFAGIRRVRQAIYDGRIWELACESARSHPKLLEALAVLKTHSPWIEKYTPSTRPKGIMYTGVETLWRPEAYHAIAKLFSPDLYNKDSYLLVPFMGGNSIEWAREHRNMLLAVSSKDNKGILVDTIFGPIPLELSESFPFGSMILPVFPPDLEELFYPTTEERRSRLLSKLLSVKKEVEVWEEDMTEWGQEFIQDISDDQMDQIIMEYETGRMRTLCNFQFFPGADKTILGENITLTRSRNTGKVRNIFSDGEHVLSLRAEDGLFTLKVAGAAKMVEKEKGNRVVVDAESGMYNRQGKNVMAKFVLMADEEINPSDEVYVIDDNDTLLAVGRALLTAAEIKDFTRGVAVKVRDGVGVPDNVSLD